MQLVKWLTSVLTGLILIILVVIYLLVDSAPLVRRNTPISPDTIAQARALFKEENALVPAAGGLRQTSLPFDLVDQGLNYLSSRYLQGRGELRLAENSAEIRLSIPLPLALASLSSFLNLRTTLGESENKFHITEARIGSLPLPPQLLELAIDEVMNRSPYATEWQLALQSFRRLEFDATSKKIDLSYVWTPAILDKARAFVFNPADIENVRQAHAMFVGLLASRKIMSPVDLVDVLNPMLRLKANSPLEEQRATLLVLAAYLVNKDLSSLIPEASQWPKPRQVTLQLLKRDDSAQHFIISAALAAWGGEPVADAIGLYKEIADTEDGSGFSFDDLAVDRAGTRFGKVLREKPSEIQRLLAQHPFADSDLAPKISDLPGNINKIDFQRRFGEPGSPAYMELTNEIERRLDRIPLYQ